MKAVIPAKRRYTYKDVLLFFGIVAGHFFFFIVYILCILALRIAIKGGAFFPPFDFANWIIYYPLLVAPSVNAALHIIYAERGGAWLRFIMWVNTVSNIVIVAVVAFIR